MGFVKKTWVDRQSQYPNRRTLTDTTSGVAQTVAVVRDEGTVTVEGDAFNAANMNDLETRVESGFNAIDFEHLTDVEFTVTEDSSGNTLQSPIVFKIVGA